MAANLAIDPFLTGGHAHPPEARSARNVEEDPFLTSKPTAGGGGGHYGTEQQRQFGRGVNMHMRSVAALVFVPWGCFAAMVIAFAILPPGGLWRLLALLIWMGCLGFSAVCYFVQGQRTGPLYKYMGVLVLVACVAAPVAGQKIFETDMTQYWMHKNGVAYRGVVPSKPADAYQDANLIGFSAMSRLDLRQVLGNRPQGSRTTYCVAPIIDARSPSKEVNFWAAGLDCCEPLRSFLCGDAANAEARTGIVMPSSTSQYAADRWDLFRKAASDAAELYGLTLPERPIFVRWHVDAKAVQSESLHQGIVEVILISFIYLMVSLFLAAALHWNSAYHGAKRELQADWASAEQGARGKQQGQRRSQASCC